MPRVTEVLSMIMASLEAQGGPVSATHKHVNTDAAAAAGRGSRVQARTMRAGSPARVVRHGPQRRRGCRDCPSREVVLGLPLAKGAKQHLHAVVVAVTPDLTLHHVNEKLVARLRSLCPSSTSSGARSTTGGEDLLHPPLRAAEARGDEERAETGSTRFGDELLVDGARHEPQNSEKQKSAARHGQTF